MSRPSRPSTAGRSGVRPRVARPRAVPALLATALVSGVLAGADVAFEPAEEIPLTEGITATCVALGDLDGDGALDAVVTGRNGDGVVDLLRNDGTGTFTPFGALVAPTQTDWVELADLDGDDALDVVVGVRSGVGRVVAWRNAGDGTFGDPVVVRSTGRETRCIALADLDGDELRDVAALGYGSDEAVIERATAPFAFERDAALRIAAFANGSASPQHVRARDLDDDGDVDLAAVSIGTSRLFLAANDGSGAFAPWRSWRAPLVGGIRGGCAASAIADFDGDGALDFAVPQTTFGTQYLVVFLGDGAGGVRENVTFVTALQGPSWFPLAADFDADGDADLVVTTALPGQVLVLENVTEPDGALAFDVVFTDLPSQFIRHAATGDVDADGDLDLVVADISVDRLLLYRNASGGGGGVAGAVPRATRLERAPIVAPAADAAARHAAIVAFVRSLADVRRGEIPSLARLLEERRRAFAAVAESEDGR